MTTKEAIKEHLERPVAFNPKFARLAGSVKAGLFLSQLYYWHGLGEDEDGWIYKKQSQWTEETGLSIDEQETLRKRLKAKGYIEERLAKNPARLYYRANLEKILADLKELDHRNPRNKTPEIPETSIGEPPKQDSGNPRNKTPEIPETILREYPENTTESTHIPGAPSEEVLTSLIRLYAHEYFGATGRLYVHGVLEREHLRKLMLECNLPRERVEQDFRALGRKWRTKDARFWQNSILKYDSFMISRLDLDLAADQNADAEKAQEHYEYMKARFAAFGRDYDEYLARKKSA